MIGILAIESAVPTSVFKAALCLLVLLGWARWATIVDKDTMYYHLNRRLWNGVQVAAAAAAFLAILFIPIFFVGLPVGLVILIGAAAGYVMTRNKAVPEAAQWHFDADLFRNALARRGEERAVKNATLRIKPGPDAPSGLKPVPMADDPQYEPHMALEEMLEPALRRNAQRLDMTGSESQFNSRMIIDGAEYRGANLAPASAVAMIDYLKTYSGMDVEDRRRRQTGQCKVHIEELGEHELRVSTAGSTRGLTCSILIDPIEQVMIPYKKLGLLDRQADQIKALIEEPSGVVLVATPPGQGRTTTLYALVQQHDPYTMDLHAMEPAIEAELEGITQHEVPAEELSRKLESLLLRDPQVVMVASVEDAETAQAAARAGAEQKRIYAGLRADDAFTALKKWAKAVGDLDLAARGLSAAVSQRLLRRLCEYCRQRYKPDLNVLRKLNLPADRIETLYKSTGRIMVKDKPEPCPACNGLGYRGRVAAFEILTFDDQARQLIQAGKLTELRTHLKRQKTIFLQDAVLAKVASGQTSISEATRVLEQEKPRTPRQKAG